MKDLIANQLVKYLEARGVKHIFGLCGHTNIAVLAALSKSRKIKFINTRHEQIAAHAADGYARATNRASVAAVAPLARPHQRGDRRGQRRARLDPDGRDRRRRADALLRQASAPGSEPARGRVAVRDLPAVRQARVARGFAAPVSRDPRKGVHARRERPPGPGAGRRADGHLLQGDRRRAVEARPRQRQGAAQAVARRRDRRGDHPPAARREDAAALRRRRHPARRRRERDARARRAPVAAGRAHADGQGRAARRPSADPRDDRVLGHEVHQRQVQAARTGSSALGTRFSEADCSSWEEEYTFRMPADEADPHRHRSGRDRPQLPGGDRRGGGPQGGAEGTEPGRPQARAQGRAARRSCVAEMAANRKKFVAGNRKAMESDAWPMRPERILADLRAAMPRDAILCTDVGWNKNGMAQQYPIYTPGSVFTPGGFATMGFGSPAALGAKVARAGQGRRGADRRRRLRPEPGGARHRVRGGHRGHLGDHEQPRVRHHRRPREGALRHDLRHGVREGRQDLVARLRGDRPRLRHRRRQGRLRRRVQAGAGEGDQVEATLSSSTST